MKNHALIDKEINASKRSYLELYVQRMGVDFVTFYGETPNVKILPGEKTNRHILLIRKDCFIRIRPGRGKEFELREGDNPGDRSLVYLATSPPAKKNRPVTFSIKHFEE